MKSWQRLAGPEGPASINHRFVEAEAFTAAFQWCSPRAHRAMRLRIASQMSLVAASSVGKWPRVVSAWRICRFTFSRAFVV